MDFSSVDFLPDQELIKAGQGGAPGIPSWLALAQLQTRNAQRASAPVQAPQGTIAQDIVSQALRGAGITTQPQQPTNAPQSSGILAGSQPSSFAKGGPVRYAGGGETDDIGSGITALGLAPKEVTINPAHTDYIPTVTPDTGTLEENVARVSPLFGKAPDFDRQQARIDANAAKSQQGYGLGSYLQDMVAGILGGKSVSPVANFGTSLAASDAKERGLQQQNFENSNQSEKLRTEVENRQFERQKAIADSAERYHQLNFQEASAQDKLKVALAEGNSKNIQEAQEKTAELASQRAQHLLGAAKLFSNAGEAKVLGNMAAAQGNTKLKDFADAAADAANGQLQKVSDITQKREQAVEGQRSADAMRQMVAGHDLAHKYKMQEMGVEADGDLDSQNPNTAAQLIANYHTKPLSQASLIRPAGQAIMKQVKAINPDYDATYYEPIQDARKQMLPNGKIKTNIDAANTAVAHLDLLDQYGKALGNKDMQAINSLKNKFGEQMGNAAPTNFDGVKHQVAGELVGILKKNGIADQDSLNAVNESMKNISGPKQLSGFIDSQMQIMGGKIGTVKKDIAALPGIPKDDPLHAAVSFNDTARKALIHRGYDPDDISKGKVLAGLPAGNGKKIDADTAAKFVLAADHDVDKAKKLAYEFGYR